MESQKTHWRTLHPTDYIGAYAFEPDEEKILTIKSAGRELVKDEKGKEGPCLVVHWKEKGNKPMIVNVTNSKAISTVAGSPYIEDWPGVKVQLYTKEVLAFGETMEAIRVRPIPPKLTKPELSPESDKWQKAVESVAGELITIEKIKKNYVLSAADEKALKEAVAALVSREEEEEEEEEEEDEVLL